MQKGNYFKIKTPEEIKIMAEAGCMLANVNKGLVDFIEEGVNAYEVEELANVLIKKEGGTPSFKMVPGYRWATCVNINAGIVHGIPSKGIVFKKGDIVSVDCGVYYKGFHSDASFSLGIKPNDKLENFLKTGKIALQKAIEQAQVGNRIYDISLAIESTLRGANLTPIRALVGHGVGRELHEDPQIPCFTYGKRTDSPEIPEGAVIAIEVMYSAGSPDLVLEKDNWTISTSDGKISGLFEDTVAVTQKGPQVLTKADLALKR